ILSTLPISWMGVGVRETLYVLFFAPRYLDEPQALLFGGIWLAGMVVAAGFGGLVSLWRIDDLNVLTRQQASELEAMAAELDLQQPLTSSAAAKK
ncbi:MAG TPA: hypothetical protein PLP17_06385, partial [Oligoflexia bacterium]|nr:hypothetical protein [Oligoflexia bacterium]